MGDSIKPLHILNELTDHINIKVNSCLEGDHEPAFVESKVHNDYDIWILTDGDVTIEMSEFSRKASKGDVVFFFPEMPYTARVGLNGCRFIYLHFDLFIGNNHNIINDFCSPGIIPGEFIKHETEVFLTNWSLHKDVSVSSLSIKGLFTFLLVKILELSGHPSRIIGFPTIHCRKNKSSIMMLQPVLKYVSDNLGKKIKVSELASLVNMSEKYFITFFKSALGISPLVYINQLKMNRAREYLYEGAYNIKQIASLLGYADQFAFSKAFKKYFNEPPSNFL